MAGLESLAAHRSSIHAPTAQLVDVGREAPKGRLAALGEVVASTASVGLIAGVVGGIAAPFFGVELALFREIRAAEFLFSPAGIGTVACVSGGAGLLAGFLCSLPHLKTALFGASGATRH